MGIEDSILLEIRFLVGSIRVGGVFSSPITVLLAGVKYL